MANGSNTQSGGISAGALSAGLNAPARPEQRTEQKREQREAVREQPRLQRRFKANDDKFHIPDRSWPPGMTWEWKRHTIGGKEELNYEAELRLNHWEPVLIEHNQEVAQMIAPFGQKSGPIIRADLILMQRPTYLCDDAREEQQQLTDRLMRSNRSKMKEAPPNTFPRLADDKRTGPAIRKTMEAVGPDELS